MLLFSLLLQEPAPDRELRLDSPPAPFPSLADSVAMAEWLDRPPDTFLAEVGRLALQVPNLVVEGSSSLALPDRLGFNGQTFFDQGPGQEDFVTVFSRILLKKERSFFAGLGDSELATSGVEAGTAEIDRHRFDDYQVRILFDSLKRAYRERYQIPSLDLDTAIATFSTGNWLDALVLPTAVTAYTYRFGLDKKWSPFEGLRLQVRLERGSRVYRTLAEDSHHHLGSLALTLFELPISAFLSVDAQAGRPETAFLGIGTDFAAVLEAVGNADPEP